MQIELFSKTVADIKTELHKDIIGQDDVINNVIIAIIAGGNVLLEGVPGVGKTRLVRSLGRALNMPYSRILEILTLFARHPSQAPFQVPQQHSQDLFCQIYLWHKYDGPIYPASH